MKYIWLLVLLGLMRVTWSMTSEPQTATMQDITDQQNTLSELIREQVMQARPNVKEVNFLQLYTEQGQKPGQILARYRYAILEPTKAAASGKSDMTEQIVEGVLQSNDGGISWVVTNSSSPYLNFLEGTKISLKEPDNAQPEAPSHEQKSPEHKSESEHH